MQSLVIPCGAKPLLNKQWVPQARDVFKQKKDMVTFTRTIWLLSRERAAGEERKPNTEEALHVRTAFHWSTFFFCHFFTSLALLRQTFLLPTSHVLGLDLETAGPSNCCSCC